MMSKKICLGGIVYAFWQGALESLPFVLFAVPTILIFMWFFIENENIWMAFISATYSVIAIAFGIYYGVEESIRQYKKFMEK